MQLAFRTGGYFSCDILLEGDETIKGMETARRANN